MGLVRLTESQVDELNKQFLNEEVFADPEVLYYVWTPFFDSLSGNGHHSTPLIDFIPNFPYDSLDSSFRSISWLTITDSTQINFTSRSLFWLILWKTLLCF